MVSQLKQWGYNRKLRQLMHGQHRLQYAMPWEKISRVAIVAVCDHQLKPADIQAAIKQLERNNKDVYAFCYLPQNEALPAQMQADSFTAKDCNFFGIPKQELISPLTERSTDLLIYLNATASAPLMFAVELNKAHLKAALLSAQTGAFDLCINAGDKPLSPLQLVKEIQSLLSHVSEKPLAHATPA